MKKMLIVVAYFCIVFGQGSYPICAFHVDDTLWFQGAGEDSLGLNKIWIGGNEREDSVKFRKLIWADSFNLKATLYNAVKDSRGGDYW